MSYNGWMIPDGERARLLALYPPRFPIVKASHITNLIDPDYELPVDADISIVARVRDDGLEAFVVRVNGTMIRPDGQIYHLTYSMVEGRSSKESNEMIARVNIGSPVLYSFAEDSEFVEPMDVIPLVGRGFYCAGDAPYVTSPLTR